MTPDRGDRGVSDVLGYVLVFAVVVVAVTLLVTNGLGTVESVRTNARLDAAQGGLAVVDANVEGLHRSGVPRRSTALQLNGGRLSLAGTTAIGVVATHDGEEVTNYTDVGVRLVHRVGDRSVSLDFGGQFRTGAGGATTVTDPPPFAFVRRDAGGPFDRVTLPVMLQRGNDTVDSRSQVSVLASASGRRLVNHSAARAGEPPVRGEITVVTEPSRARAWAGYFDERGLSRNATATDLDAGVVVYEFETRRLVVHEVRVEFGLR
ncbi:DUF7289 family protein [Halosegnis marinus]|uniref:Archaellin/type IV pilin N-terminal domain-containing protein n=1 Tax=Halosegnis marinus TaxID=3034023 RepID=A0ABD5ZMG0_9EURY|nr:archaellin/type IV pilin N-terminal domain-containing protein [Halosegnis sp. DT85]